jgi:hypothetical protein
VPIASDAKLDTARTIEVLADVSAYAVIDEELPAGMISLEVADVKDHVLKNDQLLPIPHSLLKLHAAHSLHRRLIGSFLPHIDPSSHLKPDHCQEED